MNCPLCHSSNVPVMTVEKRPVRDYGHCPVCDMIAMKPTQRLPKDLEKARYDHHENDDTEGYRQFLRPLFEEIEAYCRTRTTQSALMGTLKAHSLQTSSNPDDGSPRNGLSPGRLRVDSGTLSSELRLLDYGCGPTAFFAKWLQEAQLGSVSRYDLYYFTDQTSLQRDYDVIASTEVWEHFRHPQEEIEQLTRLLKPGGIFAIATSAPPSQPDEAERSDFLLFQNWYYRRDLTHMVFYSKSTMRWIARKFGLILLKAESPYWIFQKPLEKAEKPSEFKITAK